MARFKSVILTGLEMVLMVQQEGGWFRFDLIPFSCPCCLMFLEYTRFSAGRWHCQIAVEITWYGMIWRSIIDQRMISGLIEELSRWWLFCPCLQPYPSEPLSCPSAWCLTSVWCSMGFKRGSSPSQFGFTYVPVEQDLCEYIKQPCTSSTVN